MDHPSPVSLYQLLPIDNLKKACGCTNFCHFYFIKTGKDVQDLLCNIFFTLLYLSRAQRKIRENGLQSLCVCAGFWQKSSMNGGVTVSRLRVVSGNNYTQSPIFGCRRAKFTSQTLLSLLYQKLTLCLEIFALIVKSKLDLIA